MPRPQIRRATKADVPAIEAIVNDTYGPYVERLRRRPAPMMDDYGRLVGSGFAWIVAIGEEVGGLIVLRREADHVLVSNAATARAHQGRGFGRQLLGHAEAYAREGGFNELRLYTNELMHENLSIFAKLGREEYAHAEQDDFRRVFMRKWIGAR